MPPELKLLHSIIYGLLLIIGLAGLNATNMPPIVAVLILVGLAGFVAKPVIPFNVTFFNIAPSLTKNILLRLFAVTPSSLRPDLGCMNVLRILSPKIAVFSGTMIGSCSE